MGSLMVLEPTGSITSVARRRVTARRPRSLNGAVIGLVANGLGESERLLDALYAELANVASVAGAVRVLKPGISVPPSPEDWKRLTSEATVAIAGFGGCGSCSSRALRDAIELELEGIPAVALVHEALAPAVRAMSELSGMPGYPHAVLAYPHLPIARWEPDEVELIAKKLAPVVLRLLTTDDVESPAPV